MKRLLPLALIALSCLGQTTDTAGRNCATTTVPYTALTAATTSQAVSLGISIPLNATVILARYIERIQFACSGGCSGVTAMTISVGRSGAAADYAPAGAIMQVPSNTNFFSTGGALGSTLAAASVTATFLVTNGTPGNLGTGSATNLTAGSIDVKVCYVAP